MKTEKTDDNDKENRTALPAETVEKSKKVLLHLKSISEWKPCYELDEMSWEEGD